MDPYFVKAQGRLRRRLRPEGDCLLWTGSCTREGHGQISVRPRRMVSVHRLAWFLHYGVWPTQVNHRCGRPNCCAIGHLYEGTQRENGQDAAVQGALGSGQRLTVEDVAEIHRRLDAGGCTQAAIAREFGVDPSTISDVRRGKSWAHRERTVARLGG